MCHNVDLIDLGGKCNITSHETFTDIRRMMGTMSLFGLRKHLWFLQIITKLLTLTLFSFINIFMGTVSDALCQEPYQIGKTI